MTFDKDIIYKFGKFEISKYKKGIAFGFGHSFIAFYEFGIMGKGRIFEHRIWEIDIFWGENSLDFCTWIGRYCDHYLYVLNFNIFKLINFSFDICDNREWDYYKNKRTYEIYDYYNNMTLTYPVGVKPHFKRRKEKSKWYLNTQYLKIYNFDFLNNPWGLTIDWSWFPLLIYSKFSYGVNKTKWFDFNIELKKEDTTGLTFNFRLNIFSRFIEFEIGENTVIREANLDFIDDFDTLKMFGADIYKTGGGLYDNIIECQVVRRNLAYLYVLLECSNIDLSRFNTDEILITAAYRWCYKDEIFDYLTQYITFIKNWEKVEDMKPDMNLEAYEKLLKLKDNPITVFEDKPLKKYKLFNISFYCSLQEMFLRILFLGYTLFRFNIRRLGVLTKDTQLESNFQLYLTRSFWIRYYFLTGVVNWKNFVISIAHNNVYLLDFNLYFLGAWFTWQIGTATEMPEYNSNKQRPMTTEEMILGDIFNKDINFDVKKRRKKKYKEFYNSKFLKIYNSNFLNKPYGRAFEFYLPFNYYLKFSFNRLDYDDFKNETHFDFKLWNNELGKGRYLSTGFALFKHYLKIVLSPNSIARYSIIHSDSSLAKISTKKFDDLTINSLFYEIEFFETWIYKKIVDKGIDLSNLDFDDLIYKLAFRHSYNKNSLDYMLKVAKNNNVRLCFSEKNKAKTNAEILDYLKNEIGDDFEEPVLAQLIEYVENQDDIDKKRRRKMIGYDLYHFENNKAFLHSEGTIDGKSHIGNMFCINTKGEILFTLPHVDMICTEYTHNDAAVVYYRNGSALINSKGEFLTDFIYGRIDMENGINYCYAYKNGKWGVLDMRGIEVVPCIYDDIYDISENGYATYCLNGKWGMLNCADNTVIIPFIYEDISYTVINGLINVKLNNKWGVVNEQNEVVIDFKYDNIFNSNEAETDIYIAQLNGKCGVIDKDENILESFIYDDVNIDSGDGELYAIKKGDKYALYSTLNKQFITDFIYEKSNSNLNSNYGGIIYPNFFELTDTFGKDAIKMHYDGFFKTYFSDYGDGIAIVTKEQKCGAINENWDVVIPFEYARLNTCSEGLICARKFDGTEGVIDKNNNVVIPFGKYSYCYQYSCGYVRAWSKETGDVYLDKTGKILEIKL